jgi:hypothetical protein
MDRAPVLGFRGGLDPLSPGLVTNDLNNQVSHFSVLTSFNSVGLGRGPRVCISQKLTVAVDAMVCTWNFE